MKNRRKIIAGILIVVLIGGYAGIKIYAGNIAEKKLNEVVGDLAVFADVSYEKVSVDLLGLNVRINEVNIKPVGLEENIVIDDIVIYNIDDKHEFPSYLHMALNGINIDSDNTKDIIKELGYDELKANMELNYKYKADEKKFRLVKLSTGLENLGTTNLKFHISNINLDTENIIAVFFTYPQILIHSAEFSYEDDSFVPRLLKMVAKKKGVKVESIISKIIKEIDGEISKAKDKVTKETLVALKNFIEGPDKLTITILPDKPIPVGRLLRLDSQELPRLLNVKVKS